MQHTIHNAAFTPPSPPLKGGARGGERRNQSFLSKKQVVPPVQYSADRLVQAASKRGAVLIAVIVCVVVITLICGALMRICMSESQRGHAEERQLQATWLAESALERAAAKLAAAREYAGETWELAAEELGGQWNATVTISVEKLDGEPNRRLVHVQADYPNEPRLRVRQSKQVQVQLSSEPTGDKP